MITCIREDVSPNKPIVAHNTPTPGIENALYRVIKEGEDLFLSLNQDPEGTTYQPGGHLKTA